MRGRAAATGPARRRRWRVLLAGAAGAAALGATTHPAGASGGVPAEVASLAPALVPASGGSITVDVPAVPTTLNVHTVAGDTPAGREIGALIWPQIYTTSLVLTPQLDSAFVSSVEVVDAPPKGPQTVVYQIDPRAVWSDGVPITAQDFVYAWQVQRGGATDVDGRPDSVAASIGYRDIASVTGSADGRTVTVRFATPFADWGSLFDDLLPAHVAAVAGWNGGFGPGDVSRLVSGGPFRVTSWVPGVRIVLERNPLWWGPAPKLQQIVVQAVPGASGVVAGLLGRQVQAAWFGGFGPQQLAQVSSVPWLESQSHLGTTMLQLAFDTRTGPLAAPSVRQGIAHLIDRSALVGAVAGPLNRFVGVDDNHLRANAWPDYTANGAGYGRVDRVAAAKLLAAGGIIADAQGTWSSGGHPMVLRLAWAEDDPWSAAVGPAIAAQLVSGGFDVAQEPVTAAQLAQAILPSGNFDLAVVPVPGQLYLARMAQLFSTSPAVTGSGGVDWTGFDDPRVDQLLLQAAQQLNLAQEAATYQQVDQLLWQDMPTLPLFAEPTLVVNDVTLANVEDNAGPAGALWACDTWARLVPATPSRSAAAAPAAGRQVASRDAGGRSGAAR